MAEQVKSRYPQATICYPDATGKARKTSSTKSDHQILIDQGCEIRCQSTNPPVKERVNAFSRLVRDNRITVEKGKCPELVADCERMVWKSGDLDKTSDPARSHAFDAASYAIHYKHPLIKMEPEFIPRYGRDAYEETMEERIQAYKDRIFARQRT